MVLENKLTVLTYLSTGITRLREHFPLTIQGVLTLALMLLALQIFGYGSMDLVVFALTICAIVILLFSLFCVIFGGLMQQFRVRNRLNELTGTNQLRKLEAGFPNETGFSLSEQKYFPLIKISWQVIYPDSIDTRIKNVEDYNLLEEEIVPQRRCKTSRIVRRFTVSDVLGFCRYSWRQSQDVSLTVLPKSNSIRALPLLRSLTAEDGIPSPSGNPEGDRMEIRPYVPGDSVRNIMWKVYARNRQLNVRLSEKSVFHSNRTVAYLISSPHDEAAAAVARVAIESGALGEDWSFSADGSESSCEDVNSALDAIAASRALGAPFSYGLDNFLRKSAAQVGTHCIVFASAESGPWVQNLKQSINQFKGHFSLVMATDGFKEEVNVNIWHKLIFNQPKTNTRELQMQENGTANSSQTGKSELGLLLTDINQSVESTMVVDRNTGLSFDHRLRRV
jgi:hypothetical protein